MKKQDELILGILTDGYFILLAALVILMIAVADSFGAGGTDKKRHQGNTGEDAIPSIKLNWMEKIQREETSKVVMGILNFKFNSTQKVEVDYSSPTLPTTVFIQKDLADTSLRFISRDTKEDWTLDLGCTSCDSLQILILRHQSVTVNKTIPFPSRRMTLELNPDIKSEEDILIKY